MDLTLVNTVPLWGGGEVWTRDVARALAARGHAVRVVAREDGELLPRAVDAGIPVHPVPARGWGARRGAVAALGRALADAGDGVVVCVTGKDVRLVSPVLTGLPHRLVFSRHLDLPLGGGWLRRFTFRRVDAMLANSDATRRTLLASLRGFPADRVMRVYNPMPLDALRAATASDLRPALGWEDAFVIGIAARLTAQKGHDVLLDAFARVRAEAADARLLVAGTGPLESELHAQAERLGLGDACRFAGHVEPVARVYRACDVTAAPSRFEGFCFSAVESEALGVPVVASRVSSLPEVVADGETGLLVPPEDPAALAGALLALYRDPARRAALAAAGPAFADRFAEAPMVDELERVLGGLTRR